MCSSGVSPPGDSPRHSSFDGDVSECDAHDAVGADTANASLAAAASRAVEAACRARAAKAHACAVAAHRNARKRSEGCGSRAFGSDNDPEEADEADEPWRNPAANWQVEVDEPVLWELHFWAQGYDHLQTEEHALLIEQLQKRATEDHSEIVSLFARDNLRKLDLLQSSTLSASPFGNRCARGWYSHHLGPDSARAPRSPALSVLSPSP